MPAKIRLARHGRRKNPFYHIVVADARAPRDGKFIQKLGVYNPMTKPATIELDRDAAFDWIMKGAQPTETARAILKFKGIFYKKHLQRGVIKGSFSQEEADKKYKVWVDEKEAKVSKRREEELKILDDKRRQIAEGTPKSEVAPATEELSAFADAATEELKAFTETTQEGEEAKAETPATDTPESTPSAEVEVVSEPSPNEAATDSKNAVEEVVVTAEDAPQTETNDAVKANDSKEEAPTVKSLEKSEDSSEEE